MRDSWVAHAALLRLEPYAGKLARTVLRGRSNSNVALLPDKPVSNPLQNCEKSVRDAKSNNVYMHTSAYVCIYMYLEVN